MVAGGPAGGWLLICILHMLHIAHIMAFERIIVHSRLHSAFSAFERQLHFSCICIFCILRVIAFRCIMQYLHSLHFARDCISLHYAIYAFVAFARDCISLHYAFLEHLECSR